MIASSGKLFSVELLETSPKRPTFYVVGQRKFALLFVSTFGFYWTYWTYKNWRLYRAATGNKVLPLARTIMGVFFVYSLFMKVDRRIFASGRRYRWYPRSLALAVILTACAGATRVWVLDAHVSFALFLLVLLLLTCCLMRVQAAINFSEYGVEEPINSTLTFANGIWVGLGLSWWGVVILTFYFLVQGGPLEGANP